MATITVRNLPDEVIEMIKNRAARNKRSMEQEVRLILSEAVYDRERAMKHIELLWEKQKRPISREEVDAWLKQARQRDDT
ncbi:MAG: Arc family DNA-binding protein [Spirochaetaceae bacterium]|nr:MAG: Arc family DNA-binding protein [Spirochaetaceae bacterium]